MTDLRRVIVTRPMIGVAHMQVCAVADATDDEILTTCNRENPSGMSQGWVTVHRSDEGEDSLFRAKGPVTCEGDAGRLHILVSC